MYVCARMIECGYKSQKCGLTIKITTTIKKKSTISVTASRKSQTISVKLKKRNKSQYDKLLVIHNRIYYIFEWQAHYYSVNKLANQRWFIDLINQSQFCRIYIFFLFAAYFDSFVLSTF